MTTAAANGNGASPAAPAGLDRARLQIEGGVEIPCWFNPKESSITKSGEVKSAHTGPEPWWTRSTIGRMPSAFTRAI